MKKEYLLISVGGWNGEIWDKVGRFDDLNEVFEYCSREEICDINGYGGTTSDKYIRDTPDNMRGKDEAPPGGVFGIGYTGVSPVQIDNNSWIVFRAASSISQQAVI